MSRWHLRLTELRAGRVSLAPAASAVVQTVQTVQTVQNPHNVLPIEQFEQFEHRSENDFASHGVMPDSDLEVSPCSWSDACEERAAIIEYESGAAAAWAEALARLEPDRAPANIPVDRWRLFVDDCGRFLDQGWAHRAAELDWSPFDLFGCDRERPFVRIEQAGLLWLVRGDRIGALGREAARIVDRIGMARTYRRRERELGELVLAWELIE